MPLFSHHSRPLSVHASSHLHAISSRLSSVALTSSSRSPLFSPLHRRLTLSFIHYNFSVRISEQTKQIEDLQKQNEDLAEEKKCLLEEIERILSETGKM